MKSIRRLPILAVLLTLASCIAIPVAESDKLADEFNFGVMVMAHGGSDEWNAHLTEAVEPLQQR
ncbi:MAG: hypothetical protein F4122_07790, partial [Gammaproteobacteria bacterium]|nr:hypothetical protein [Gammaproteobacteria bacterium]